MPEFTIKQRVLISWGPQTAYAARVRDIRSEFGRGGLLSQAYIQVEYEVDGQRLWHKPSELSPLAEDAVVAAPDDESEEEVDESDCVMVGAPSWQALTLRCCYSFMRLADPARCFSCTHPACCNYDSLVACVHTTGACPVIGCQVRTRRSSAVVRDDALRVALLALPASAQTCWVRGQAEIRLEPPTSQPSAAAPEAPAAAPSSHAHADVTPQKRSRPSRHAAGHGLGAAGEAPPRRESGRTRKQVDVYCAGTATGRAAHATRPRAGSASTRTVLVVEIDGAETEENEGVTAADLAPGHERLGYPAGYPAGYPPSRLPSRGAPYRGRAPILSVARS